MSRYLARGKLQSPQIRAPRLDVGLPRDNVWVSGPMEASVAADPHTSAGCRPTSGRCLGIWTDGSFRRRRSAYIGRMSAYLGAMSGYLDRRKLPSPQIRVHRLDVGRPRDNVWVSGPTGASVAVDPRTLAGCRPTSGQCLGIWPNGSFRRRRSAHIGWMSADLGTMSGYLDRRKLPSSQIRGHRLDVGRPRDDVWVSGPMGASVATDPRTSAGRRLTSGRCLGIWTDGSFRRRRSADIDWCRLTSGRCLGIWPDGSFRHRRSMDIGWMSADVGTMSGYLDRGKLP